MITRELIGAGLVLLGTPFFVASTLGLLRFPDIYARLHANTKADNVGLGLICLGLALQADHLAAALKFLLIWVLVLLASSTSATLIASAAFRHRGPVIRRKDDDDHVGH